GAELYSVAMLLSEMKLLNRCHLLGTDCRAGAIRRARHGVFDESAIRTIPLELQKRYVIQENGAFRMVEAVRRSVHWRAADVLSLHEPGVWDMILCRNMAMYMSADAGAQLWRRLAASLRPGGI